MAKAKKTVVEAMKKPVDVKEIPFETPKNWKWVRLIQLYNFIDYRGKTPTKLTEGVRLVTAKNIKKGYLDYSVSDYISEEEYTERQSRGISKKGDILFTTEAPMGNVALADLDVYSAGQRVITFQKYPNTESISNKFYYYYILSEWFQLELQKNKTGSTVEGIKAEKLMYIPVPLPPEREQQCIVEQIESLFAKLDEAKEKIQIAMEDAEKNKLAILQEAFTGNLTKVWRRGNNRADSEWRKVTLGDVLSPVKDKYDPSYNTKIDIPYIGLEHIEKGKGICSKGSPDEVKSLKTLFKEGDLLYGKLRPYLNKHDVAEFDGMCSTDILVYRADNVITAKYMNYLLGTINFIEYAVEHSSGINLPRTSEKAVSAYKMEISSIEEQAEIVRILDTFLVKQDTVVSSCESVLEQIELMKKAILAKAFRGELGTNNPDDEFAVNLLKQIIAENL